MSNTVINLDRLAAQHAQAAIANTKDSKSKDVENTVTKALGVLQENGVYACFLYLLAKEKELGKKIIEEMLNLLEGLGFGWNQPGKENSPEVVLKYITDHVTQDLERLLLTKETLEQMLIYARYGAKAREEATQQKEEASP
ncbi:hypothetical protein [Oscillatoria sp. FACHB-1406]|uniref:hypothetical protein n=1 Tax=Oscillatoria sp. FACHB-1406 TaxID=2692846 RepID=UPI00168877AC|nr:hypothetical protein [Oscillatoria sp. FACHB-1406]MBD2578555.1 hypothetical protein [Oscillatoria sp. FACHB-1406]